MLQRFIGTTRVRTWFRENSRHIKPAATVCAVLLCLDVLVYGVLVAPANSQLRSGEARASVLRQRHAEAVLFERRKPLFSGIMAGIPSQKDMPLFVKEYVQTARRLGLAVSAVNYDIPRRESGELAMLSFSFPAEGKYPEIKRFIYEVETSDRLVGIQDLKLESDRGRVSMIMKLMTYVRGL